MPVVFVSFCITNPRVDFCSTAADELSLHERFGFGQLGPGGDHHGHGR